MWSLKFSHDLVDLADPIDGANISKNIFCSEIVSYIGL
jgi:hypothetical protein